MKKIGSGIQYDVYDLENGRVKKIETSFLQKIWRFHNIAPKYKIYLHPLHNIKTTIGAGKMTKASMGFLKNHKKDIDLSLIGNPLIHNNGYDQDRITPLGERLLSSDFEKQKELIGEYIENMLSGWDYGFSDTVFNFMINSGVTAQGGVILTDLGELTWNKDDIYELIKTKHWEKRSSFNKLENIELKNYIREQFSEKFTAENLDKRWGSKLQSSQFSHPPLARANGNRN